MMNEEKVPDRIRKLPVWSDRPVSVNTIILAALEVLKRTPELDEVIHAIVAADKRVTRLS